MSYWSVEFGPKLDDLTPIPGNDVISVSPPSIELEPGAPGVPTVDKISFELDNLDSAGNQKYPSQWFDNNANQVNPTFNRELFFKVEIGGNTFRGIYASHTYTSRFEKAKVNVKGLFSIIKDRSFPAFRTFDIGEVEIFSTDFTLNPGLDLNGNSIDYEQLKFAKQVSELNSTVITDEYAKHVEDQDDTRNAFLQLGKITLLTRVSTGIVTGQVRDESGTLLGNAKFVRIKFIHRDEDIDANGLAPIGTYLNGSGDAKLKEFDKINAKIFDYDVGNGGALFNESDMPDATYVAGFSVQGPNNFDIVTTGDEIFSMLQKYKQAYDRIFQRFVNDPNFEIINIDDAIEKFAFWSDLITWFEPGKVEDNIKSLMFATSSYVYEDDGQVIFQDRLLHEDFLEPDIPADVVTLDRERYFPDGNVSENNGFTSYSFELQSRIPVMNLTQDDERTEEVNQLEIAGSNRDTELEPTIYTTTKNAVTESLDTNNDGNNTDFKFREDVQTFLTQFASNFTALDSLDDFIQTPSAQIQRFADSWQFPTQTLQIEVEKNIYPNARTGNYIFIPVENIQESFLVYLIRKESSDFNLLSTFEIQFARSFITINDNVIFDAESVTTMEVGPTQVVDNTIDVSIESLTTMEITA